MAPGIQDSSLFMDVELSLNRRALKYLHLALVNRNRRQDAEIVRRHAMCPSIYTTVPSTCTEYQELQELFESLGEDFEFPNGVEALVLKVHSGGFPLSFEPFAYGINPRALAEWPGYSDDFDRIKEERANRAKRPHVADDNPSTAKRYLDLPPKSAES
ncbi:hypothetical protein HDK77DRAFT_483457 [Phyllosticta capitalensis]